MINPVHAALFALTTIEPQESVAIQHGPESSASLTTPSKGKRSRRRRAAKMRARGWIHVGNNWISPAQQASREAFMDWGQ